ncbi:MAG: glycine cleavage system aminomethyltransferase GcvT [Deltaproteobacteria bacterium]
MGLLRTPLYDLHVSLGAKMVPFAGYEMPVQYPMGVLKEHLQTRAACGVFDVSHMGQVVVSGPNVALALERLVPVDVVGLKPGRQRYGLFTNEVGGILDDLMIANRGDHLFLVVNAACKDADFSLLASGLEGCEVRVITNRALIAVQGPLAEAALSVIEPRVAGMRFMDSAVFGDLWVSRSGYTGEDGFEVSLPEGLAVSFVERLLAIEGVAPIGLGARDSLRLEAGLCLYGHDLDDTISPIEGGLSWAIQKVRRAGGDREGGFPGADVILGELAHGPLGHRVGLLPEGRAPMREETLLFATENGTETIGYVTSGGFGPSLGRPIAMGYVPPAHDAIGTHLWGEVRGKRLPVTVCELPFVPHTYKR